MRSNFTLPNHALWLCWAIVPSIVAISVMPSFKACNMMDENVFTSILKQTITTYLSAYPMGCAHPHLQDLHNLTMINLPSTEKPI